MENAIVHILIITITNMDQVWPPRCTQVSPNLPSHVEEPRGCSLARLPSPGPTGRIQRPSGGAWVAVWLTTQCG